MPQEDSRKASLQAFAADNAANAEGAASLLSDPHSEPTVSSTHAEASLSLPTCVDPEAPMRRSDAAVSGAERKSGENHIALPPGQVLLEYTIEGMLGSGGFGITYLARDNNLQCSVAIKEYLPGDLAVRTAGKTVCPRTDSDTHGYQVGLKGFLAESRVLANFRHPHIVRVTRFFEANNTAYMVMDYEKGQPLREWLKQHGPVEEALLLNMFMPLLDGLEVVHKAGVLHRDIKPANIFVREADGSLVLLDFGSARHAGGGTSRSLTSIVTPGYAPFEQYHTHGAQGPWSDLYALGGVLYWLVTGNKPVEAPSRVIKDDMPLASQRAAGRYSDRLLRAIDWALMPEEGRRPRTVAEFRATLTGQAAAAGSTPAPAPSAPALSAKSSGLRWTLAAGAAALAVIAGAVFFPRQDGPVPERSGQAAAQAIPSATSAQAAEPGEARKTTGPKSKSVKAVNAGGQPSAAPAAAGLAPMDKTEAKEEAPPPAAAYLVFEVIPSGEIIVDGRKAGTSPPLKKLKVALGEHKIEIHGSGIKPPHYWTVKLGAGETRNIRADFSY